MFRFRFRLRLSYYFQYIYTLVLVTPESILTLLCSFQSKWLTCKRERDGRERRERDGIGHNNSPPTKRLRLRLAWGRGGVEV